MAARLEGGALATQPPAKGEEGQVRLAAKYGTLYRLVGVVLVVSMAVSAIVGALAFHGHTHSYNHYDEVLARFTATAGVKITLVAKRASMQYKGSLSAVAYVVPRETTDGTLAFDAILNQDANTTESFIWLNNRAYWSVQQGDETVGAGCMDEAHMPALTQIERSLRDAQVVDGIAGGFLPTLLKNCGPDGKLLQATFMGEPFVFCKLNNDSLNFIYGEDLDMTVEHLVDSSDIPTIAVPKLLSGESVTCDQVPAEADRPVSRNLMELSAEGFHRLVGSRRLAEMKSSQCGCKGKKKPCMFLHGLGSSVSQGLLDNDAAYWGDIRNHAPCCSSIKFLKMDTIHRGWTDPNSHNEFCNGALTVSRSKSRTIGDLILVTHSMGNLIASSAVAAGKCSMSSGVTWVSLAGPMRGSKSANLLNDICNKNNAIPKELGVIAKKCPMQPAFTSLMHESTVNGGMKANFRAAQGVLARYATKTLCGVSDVGLLKSPLAAALPVVAKLSKHDSKENDGLVDFPSCTAAVGGGGFGGQITSHNYKAQINHIDACFRNGDGWYSADKKPVKWFECAL
ncbi:unnamed protein product [Aphanomyces euteiches]